MLKKRGWDVSLLTYHPGDFFLPMLRDGGVEYTCLPKYSHWRRALAIRHILRHGDQDVVLAFLDGPVLYAELAAIPRRRWGLVVSERNAIPWTQSSRLNRLRQFHRLADYVTTNSHSNRLMIERAAPALKNRIVTIYNTVNFEAFTPLPMPDENEAGMVRIVVAARYEAQKNPEGLIRAVSIVKKGNPFVKIVLDWFGRHAVGEGSVFSKAERLVEELGLRDCVRLHGESKTIKAEYAGAHAVAMPSFFEGVSNTICEAMACGRPILSSNVCDAGNLVEEGENGFLFDPASADSMAAALTKFIALTPSQREAMGKRSREMAERLFDSETVVSRYEEVLRSAATKPKAAPLGHWVPEVPPSAKEWMW
jgi:glycosyltransferase involved in cell wall biosynthesis